MNWLFYILYLLIEAPIFRAIENHDDNEAIKLLEKPYNITVKDKWGRTPLIAASNAGNTKIVSKLISLGADVNYISKKSGINAISAGVMTGAIDVAKILIDAGANIEQGVTDPENLYENMTPLMWAANRGYVDIVQLLIDSGADLDKVDSNNVTAIMYVTSGSEKDLEVFKVLIKQKPNIEIRDWRGRNVIDEARDRCNNSNNPQMKELIEAYYPGIII